MTIEWLESYRLGHAGIDAQHETLCDRINRFLAATGQLDLADAMAKLFEYAREHFTYEETIMRAMDYPHIVVHAEQHNALLSKLNNVAELIANYTLDVANFKSFLSDWMLNHMETLDAQLVSFIDHEQA